MRSLTPVAAALLLVAAALPVSIAATNMALALLTAALLWRGNKNGRVPGIWRRTPAVWGILLYCLAGAAASAFGVDPAGSLHDNAKDLHKLWALLVFIAAFDEEPPAGVWAALAAGFAAAVAVGLGQAVRAALTREHGFPLARPHAFVHPVAYGEQLTIGLIGGLCAFLRPGEAFRKPADRRLGAALTALTAAVLVLNQTRSSIFALAAGCAAIGAVDPSTRRRGARLVAALFAIALAWELLPTGGRGLVGLVLDSDPRNAQNARYALWSVAWRMFRDHPWTGAGPGHYRTLFTTYFQGTLDNESVWGSAHNLYLHQLAERGLIGAAGLAAALGTLLAGAWNSARRDGAGRGLWALSAFAAFLVMNLTEAAFQNEQVTTLVLLVWAWGTAPSRRREIL
jgi:O-antigen ligase